MPQPRGSLQTSASFLDRPNHRFTSKPPFTTGFGGASPASSSVSPEPLADIFGAEPSVRDGMVKFSFGRDARMHGTSFGGSMGLSTWAAFSGSDDAAVVGGDFAMTADEVQPVLRALRDGGINIVAVHNHMIGETPAYYFVHFWGKGPAADLAKGLRGVLEAHGDAPG